jgi:hypothetical protein
MLPVKRCVAAAVLALSVGACSSAVKPPQGRGKIDDPRTHNPNRLACLHQHGLPAQLSGPTGIQVGALPAGPTIEFASTPGGAQFLQIQGKSQGAEVIGSALLYPNGGSDAELSTIEDCLSTGVTG